MVREVDLDSDVEMPGISAILALMEARRTQDLARAE